ncbi:MAG: helix-turn-helix transcriptional regulator [Oligoflexia bacterium]|nr:helix-turn-helix transcriptional regulator [Oligoflexia bacterium]
MKDQIDFKLVLRILKSALKKNKIHYRDLARKIGMSESGLKKLFIAEDCSFNRLVQICNAIDVSLADVLASLKQMSAKEVRFSQEQQEYFVQHPECFYYFWKLVYERVTVEEIQRQFGLSEVDTFRYLKKLDELKLIQLHENNRAKIPKVQLVRWVGTGPLMRKIRKEWSAELVNDTVDSEVGDLQHFSLRYYQLTPESYQDLLHSIQELDTEFGNRTIREISLQKSGLKSVRMISAIAQGSYVGRKKIGPLTR